jgi:hypothetical protein
MVKKYLRRCLLAGLCWSYLWLFAGCDAESSTPLAEAACVPLSEPLADIVPDTPGRVVGEPNDEIAFIYDQFTFRTFELHLSEADLAKLDASPVSTRTAT